MWMMVHAEESLALIEEARRQGIRMIVATSHRRKGMFETPEKSSWPII
jgi:protein-tyrosine phosphatase